VRLYACGGEKPLSEHPLGLGYLLTNTRDADVQIVKELDGLFGADIVGLSTNAWGISEVLDIADCLATQSRPYKLVVGGQGALWRGLENVEAIDYIVRGSGEAALQDIVDHPDLPSMVLRAEIPDLDKLNFPNRGKCGAVVPFVTSRGCPYGCRFCTSKAHWGKPQYHSAYYVIEDVLAAGSRYDQMREVRFMDDLFITPPERFRQLHERWMSHSLHKRFVPHGFVRADLLTPRILTMLIEMGIDRIRFGIESGSPRMLKLIGKGITIEQFQDAIDRVHAAGLPCYGSFVHGLPGETEEDVIMTHKFIERNRGKLLDGGTYTFKPFPGCDLYNGEDPRIFDMRVRA
jgi:radical SAM superfamily enzyme YgiQ (UPF0313 family)